MQIIRYALLFMIFITLSRNVAYTQNLSMSELVKIRKMQLADAENFIISKGWNVHEIGEYTIEFSYEPNEYDRNYAQSFLEVHFNSRSKNIYQVHISTNISTKYIEYIDAIIKYGCKLKETYVEEGRVTKVYNGATTTFLVETTKHYDSNREEFYAWDFHLYDLIP